MFLQTPVQAECHSLVPPMHKLSWHQSHCHSLAPIFLNLPLKNSLQIDCNSVKLLTPLLQQDLAWLPPCSPTSLLAKAAPQQSSWLSFTHSLKGNMWENTIFLFFHTFSEHWGCVKVVTGSFHFSCNSTEVKKEEDQPGCTEEVREAQLCLQPASAWSVPVKQHPSAAFHEKVQLMAFPITARRWRSHIRKIYVLTDRISVFSTH